MSGDATNPGETDRPAAAGDGVFAAVLFAVVSILLIVTLPAARCRSARP